MSNVSFYVLESASINDLYKTVIRLSIKAYEAENQVLIYSNHENVLAKIDDLLWTYSNTSFIPHVLIKSNEEVEDIDPIILANFEPTLPKKDILIQLADDPIPSFQGYDRIIEILYNDPEYLAKGRERFKFYRRNGIEPKTIKI